MRPLRLALDHGSTAVGGSADRDVQRDFAEERHPETLGLMARTAMAKDIGLGTAMRALEVAHVLDDAEHRHVDLREHRQPAPRIDQRQVLRRRNDDRTLERYGLRER